MNAAQATITALSNTTIFTGDSMEDNHALLMKGGKIVDIVAQARVPSSMPQISCAGLMLAPGFIDVQVNGGGNVLFNNTPTPQACTVIAAAHRRFGTTRLLVTCISDRPEITQRALAAVRSVREGNTGVLGIHIEGPHLSEERRGAHKEEYLRLVNNDDMRLYTRVSDEIILITAAPECVTPEQIRALRKKGVIVSLGHTNASPEEIRAALAAGATSFTHLFNGMGKPGAKRVPADTALEDQNSWCGLIADGHHVSDELIHLALRSKPKGKIYLVSDAMPPAASDTPESFELYGETVHVENGRCVNSEGKLAGATITLSDAVRHCVKIGIDRAEALRMASAYPAKFLGVDKSFGKLLPGYEADIVALDTDLRPVKTWVDGISL